MSSQQFLDTFDAAASFISSKYPASPEVPRYLAHLRQIVSHTTATNPIDDPDLEVDPITDSQLADVSLATVNNVVTELRRFHLLKYWVRATCPTTDDLDDVVVISDKAAEFRDALQSACPFCGNDHEEIDWDHMRLFLAVNFDASPRRLSLRELVLRPPEYDANPGAVERISEWLMSFFGRRGDSPAIKAEQALAANRPATSPPSTADTVQLVWGLSFKFFLFVAAICAAVYVVLGGPVAAVVLLVAVMLYSLLMWYTLSALRAGSAFERGISWASVAIASPLFLHGATGLKVAGNLHDVRSIHFEFGEADYVFIVAGVSCFLGGQFIAARIARDRIAQAA